MMDCLNELEDPRQPSNGTLHDFREMLVIAICACLSDAEHCEDFALWGQQKEGWLRRFLVLKNGIPSGTTFTRLFRLLDPKRFEDFFRRWVSGIVTAVGGQLAVDGKTVRGSADGAAGPAHIVSAFATDLGLSFGQEKVAGKSNEIVAIPELLNALFLKGYLVSIDAMGCQKAIASIILEKEGDYLLAVKGNQPTLAQGISDAFSSAQRETLPRFEHVDPSHGRLVAQITWTAPAAGVVDPTVWPQCKTIGMVASQRSIGGKAGELEQRYYISSRELTPEQLAKAVRAHWAVENQLHWVLDVSFGEDACTAKKDHAPQNLSLLRKVVLSLLRVDTTPMPKKKVSLRQKRKLAAWNDDLRMAMLGIKSL